MRAERTGRPVGRLMLHPVVVAVVAVLVTLAHAAPALAGAPVGQRTEPEQNLLAPSLGDVSRVDSLVLSIAPDGSRMVGDYAPRVIPAVIAGAITVCAAAAIGAVGIGTLNRLIAEGSIGTARQLLADAISGCVSSIAGGLAVRACRAFSPCRSALNSAISRAVDALIRTLD